MIRTHCTRFPPSFFFGGISPWSSTGSPKRKNLVTIGWNCLVQIRRIHTCLLGDKHIWLVVSFPLKNMSSSLGMMTFPTEWKVIKFHGSKPPTRYTNMIKHAYQSSGIWADPALFSSCVVHGRAQCSQAGSKQVHCCNATEALLNHSMFEWACAKWKKLSKFAPARIVLLESSIVMPFCGGCILKEAKIQLVDKRDVQLKTTIQSPKQITQKSDTCRYSQWPVQMRWNSKRILPKILSAIWRQNRMDKIGNFEHRCEFKPADAMRIYRTHSLSLQPVNHALKHCQWKDSAPIALLPLSMPRQW